MAAFIPKQAKRELTARWEWSEINETPLSMPNQPYISITWEGYPIFYRGSYVNGETILIFQSEEDFLALNLADQFWMTRFIRSCDTPRREKSRRSALASQPTRDAETTPQPLTRRGDGAQEAVGPRPQKAGGVSVAARRGARNQRDRRIWPCHPHGALTGAEKRSPQNKRGKQDERMHPRQALEPPIQEQEGGRQQSLG